MSAARADGPRPMKRIGDSRLSMAEIVGEEGLHGQRMQAGAILDLMDVLAGRIAVTHSASPVATLSFDRVDLTYPILNQDLVRLDGQLVSVGQSSMVVEVRGFRKDVAMREYMPVQRSYITMVAVDFEGRPNKNIPGLLYETPEEARIHEEVLKRKASAERWLAVQAGIDSGPALRAADVEEPFNREKREWLTPAETEIEVRRQFLPRNLNQRGTIFGGDVLLWMDRVATYTARHFTGNRNMITLAMNRIFFKQPINSLDWVTMTARVAYVRRYTLEVEIAVSLQHLDGSRAASHSGAFTVLSYDEAGFKRPITVGLKLDDADQEGLRAYEKAKARHRLWEEERAASSAG